MQFYKLQTVTEYLHPKHQPQVLQEKAKVTIYSKQLQSAENLQQDIDFTTFEQGIPIVSDLNWGFI